MMQTIEPVRLLAAAGVLVCYAVLCAAIVLGQVRKRRAAQPRRFAPGETQAWTVAFASQTGAAEELAQQTAATLELAGVPVRLCSLAQLDASRLAECAQILFVVSTYGEGDPPDDAARFAARLAQESALLGGLQYGVLALGDSSYRHFCGFGRSLDQMLVRRGAQSLFERIEMDRGNPLALQVWRRHLGRLAGASELPDWRPQEFGEWRLAARRLLNPGSAGEAIFHLELEPVGAPLPSWQSGDLAQVLAPVDLECPRDYSISSLPADGRLHLTVRLHRRDDGSAGLASGWLAHDAAIGDIIRLRVRPHARFRLEDNAARPLILIGNGTGIAGLRSHLKARAAAGATLNWLVFGERNAACDFLYREEIEAWQKSGVLQRLDLAFSRDQAQRRYVQDCLDESAAQLREWTGQGAAIYVCGSLTGMAAGVDRALASILGRDALETLAAAGRYRRDVY